MKIFKMGTTLSNLFFGGFSVRRRCENDPKNRITDNHPRVNAQREFRHLPLCPASRYPACRLRDCPVHGCTCYYLYIFSSLILTFTVVGLLGLVTHFFLGGSTSMSDPDSAKYLKYQASACSSVSKTLRKDCIAPEVTRQLKLLHSSYCESCHWKESPKCNGLANLASFQLGATVKSIYNTIPYAKVPCADLDANGFSRCNQAENMLLHDVVPGRNFNFVGEGRALIKLSGPIVVTGFTLTHPSKDMIPQGYFAAAPKDFEVWGHYGTGEKMLIGKYRYLEDKTAAQAYPVVNFTDRPCELVEVRFTSNHGNKNYTTVYRFEVHGDVECGETKNVKTLTDVNSCAWL